MTRDKLQHIHLFHSLPKEHRSWLVKAADTWPLSFQQLKMLTDYCADMFCWGMGSPDQFYQPDILGNVAGKKGAAAFFQQIRIGYEQLVSKPRKYQATSEQESSEAHFSQKQIIDTDFAGHVMGSCPVASEKTRCCNLHTLDAVQQCGFGCSYCSIQSFYHGNQVRFINNLAQHLQELQLDPDRTYHIGTGQSSDSLMWGNSRGLLDALYGLARAYPNVMLELKSKSGRIDYLLENRPPANMIFTWSLNTPIVTLHEEKGSAPLATRLQSARKLADRGSPVGFHFHPIVWYDGWRKDYTALVKQLTEIFVPEETVMISLGTLTFTQSIIKRIRNNMLKSSILQMPMEETGGKFSYPYSIKQDIFTAVYDAFPALWKEQVFFYMCMEDIRLWQPVFNRSYDSNEAFEADMLASYSAKIRRIEQHVR